MAQNAKLESLQQHVKSSCLWKHRGVVLTLISVVLTLIDIISDYILLFNYEENG